MMEKKTRGRPRAYDSEQALDRLTEVFWNKGFDDASLDDLAQAAGMNRPSLYRAFGDKAAMFRATQSRFADRMNADIQTILTRDIPFQARLADLLDYLINVYQTPSGRGCS